MSAQNFVDFDPRCPTCGSDDVEPHIGFDAEVDERGRRVTVDGWKCCACHHRFTAYSLDNPVPDL